MLSCCLLLNFTLVLVLLKCYAKFLGTRGQEKQKKGSVTCSFLPQILTDRPSRVHIYLGVDENLMPTTF